MQLNSMNLERLNDSKFDICHSIDKWIRECFSNDAIKSRRYFDSKNAFENAKKELQFESIATSIDWSKVWFMKMFEWISVSYTSSSKTCAKNEITLINDSKFDICRRCRNDMSKCDLWHCVDICAQKWKMRSKTRRKSFNSSRLRRQSIDRKLDLWECLSEYQSHTRFHQKHARKTINHHHFRKIYLIIATRHETWFDLISCFSFCRIQTESWNDY